MKQFLLSITFLFFTLFSFGQCPEPGMVFQLKFQSDVDDLLVNLGGAFCILDDIDILIGDTSPGVSNITNLDGLMNQSYSAKSISIQNTQLTSLEGFEAFNFVNDSLHIASNSQLQSLDGLLDGFALHGLDQVDNVLVGKLVIENNPVLQNIQALEDVFYANTPIEISIKNNNSLLDIGGLVGLQGTRDLIISGNNSLESFDGLENLNFVISKLTISDNSILNDLSVISDVDFSESQNFNLQVSNNPQLSVCSLNNICGLISNPGISTITINNNAPGCNSETEVLANCADCPPNTNLTFSTQAEIDAFGAQYPNCTIINGDLIITGNDIVDLSPFQNIETITGELYINQTFSLGSLDGFLNLQEVNKVRLEFTSITDITGLGGVTIVDSVNIQNNFNLSNCNIASIQPLLTAPNTVIQNNGFDCSLIRLLNNFEDCPQVFFEINSQERVNNFQLSYPNCSSLDIPISISGDDIVDLTPFSSLNETNSLSVSSNPLLVSLNGLENITIVTDLGIESNPLLQTLAPLANIISWEDIFITQNDLLIDLTGLEGLGAPTNGGQGIFTISNNLSLTSLNGVQNITSIDFLTIENNESLTTISGFDSLTTIPGTGSIRIVDSPTLETINGFPNLLNVNRFDVINNPSLTSIGIGQNSQINVKVLSIDNTSLSNLDGLTAITRISETLRIENNPQLLNFNGLSNVINNLNSLRLIDNSLLNDITGLTGISTINNIRIENCDMLIALTGIDNVSTNCSRIILIGNENLTTLDDVFINPTTIFEVIIDDNDSLTSLDGLGTFTQINSFIHILNNDALLSLDGLNAEGDVTYQVLLNDNPLLEDISTLSDVNFNEFLDLEIMNNVSLSECSIQSLCNLISASNGAFVITNNGTNCSSEMDILDACGFTQSTISGAVQFDFQNNGCTSGDYLANNILVEVSRMGETLITSTDQNGDYTIFVDEVGNYDVSIVAASLPIGFNAAPLIGQVNVTTIGENVALDFCLTATNPFNDVKVTLLPLNDARPGFESNYVLVIENSGTTILSGTSKLNFDDIRQEFVESLPIPSVTNVNSLEFDFIDLLPFEQRSIEVTMLNFIPPTNNSGDILNFLAEITPITDDATPENNTYELNQIMVNSFDPNDKLVSQGEEIFEIEVGDYLDYTVRFQNTGTADAINVRIEDELSANLNWNSFRMLSSSHDYRVEIMDGNQVAFIFNDINLPPEQTDPEGSNGYVTFQIRSNNDLLLGDSVENTASIFFDFNAPIITNTITTTVIEEPDEAPNAVCQDIQVMLDANGNATVDASIVGANSTDDMGIVNYEVVPSTFDCSQIGMNQVTLTVTDTGGNQSTCTAMIEVVDVTAPMIICSGDFTEEISQGEMYTIPDYVDNGDVTATDNCTDPLTIITQTPTPGTMVAGGTYPIEITYEDESGNLEGCAFMLIVTEILGINDVTYLNEIKLFPNPVTQNLTVSISEMLAYKSASIFSIVGKKLIETDTKTIDASSLKSGVYFITIETTQGTITKKIVKE